MKLLFVTQNIDFFRPLGLMQLSALAKQKGYETDLVVLSKENFLGKVQEYNPDVVAYTATTGEHRHYVQSNKELKSKYKDIFTIMGGSHPTSFPDVLNEAELDAICIGEGEYAFIELLENIEQGKDISNLKNIIVKGKSNGVRPLIQDLDILPFPDRELFYGKNREKALIMNFMSQKGCPYECTYCFNYSYKKMHPNENYLRSHSVDYVINEILDAKSKFKFKLIRFVDDIFTLRKIEWIREFSERYSKEVKLPFVIATRFDIMTPEVAGLLKKAGCVTVAMSIESANPRIRREILGRFMSNEAIIKGAGYCRDNNISVATFLILGLPTSTLEDEISAIDLCIEAKIKMAEFSIFTPFPKTKIGEMCVEKGWFDGDMSKINMYGFSSKSQLNCFSDKEKNAQINLRLLAPMVIRHPFLKNWVVNHLIYLPTNYIYEKIFQIGKTLSYQSKVYKLNYSLIERLEVLKSVFKLESKKKID